MRSHRLLLIFIFVSIALHFVILAIAGLMVNDPAIDINKPTTLSITLNSSPTPAYSKQTPALSIPSNSLKTGPLTETRPITTTPDAPIATKPLQNSSPQPASNESAALPPPSNSANTIQNSDSSSTPTTKQTNTAIVEPQSGASFLNNPKPVYPSVSKRLEEEGVVLLKVLILASGQVGEIKIQRSSGFERLDNAALDAVKRWHYVPAKRGDTPIDYWHTQRIEFHLD